MKRLLGWVVVLAVVAGVIGFQRGWFEFAATNEDGKGGQASVTFHAERFQHDKEILKKKASQQLKAVQDELADLRRRPKDLPKEAQVKAEKEIEKLTEKRAELETRIKVIEEAGEDKLEKLKKELEEATQELEKGKGRER
jgi:hypothetical protein